MLILKLPILPVSGATMWMIGVRIHATGEKPHAHPGPALCQSYLYLYSRLRLIASPANIAGWDVSGTRSTIKCGYHPDPFYRWYDSVSPSIRIICSAQRSPEKQERLFETGPMVTAHEMTPSRRRMNRYLRGVPAHFHEKMHSSAVMIPLRTGVVRDIRIMVYSKVMHLPLGFFSQERKGDIIARMSGDVGEIENSITSSLDMLLKNPILILFYFTTLIITSWQLTLFTIVVLPGMGWLMGKVGKKLKRQSLEAQGKWSDTMSQLEETLGGLRIIKAFIAEDKMVDRFTRCSNELRDATNKVAVRQALAHPMSEFLGTLLIVLVLWFGGMLILGDEHSSLEAPTFIFYMIISCFCKNPSTD